MNIHQYLEKFILSYRVTLGYPLLPYDNEVMIATFPSIHLEMLLCYYAQNHLLSKLLMRSILTKANINPLKYIAKSIHNIELNINDQDETRYKALYEYILKQYEIEVSRTRDLESKTTSFLIALSILATAYSSVYILHIKSRFNC